MQIPSWTLPLLGLLALSAAMLIAWRRQLRTRNAGVVDVLWTAGLGALALAYAAAGDGWLPRRVLVALLAGLWSARLTWHLARRVSGEDEDGRYAQFRREKGAGFDRWALGFFQAQAVLAVLLSLAYLPGTVADQPGWRPQDAVAIALWLVSLVGEGVADRQLAAWRADPRNRGRTCRSGLWRYSRHPNYFFEWIHWLAWPVLALGLPGGWAVWLAPAAMLFLVLKVTGIPPTEEQSLRSRGDDYRAYQRTTNAFFPGPPKAGSDRLLETS